MQYQARLFADAGFHVTLITSPLVNRSQCLFRCPGVQLISFQLMRDSLWQRIRAKLAFVAAIVRTRWEAGRSLAAEISYDPEGVCLSHLAPWKNRRTVRTAHLHETLIDPDNRRYERKACRILPNLDRIVVADSERALLLQRQLNLSEVPTVIENYPLLDSRTAATRRSHTDEFRVVYVGVLAFNQAIDTIITSVSDWPPQAHLHLVGPVNSAFVKAQQDRIRDLNLCDRITFEGWMDLEDVRPFLEQCHLGLCILRPVHEQLEFAAGASNKRYQYIQASLPQISDRNPGVPELIEQQGIGRCVDPDDHHAIAKAVQYYCDHPDECRDAGLRAFELYRSRYHYEAPFRPHLEWIRAQHTKPPGVGAAH